jgi:glutamyl-tRNA reductase
MLPNETYQEWAERVELFERGRAMQRIADGENVEEVLDEMGKRLMNKLMHPVIKAIKESSVNPYDFDEGKKRYEENYLNKYGNVADHVDGNLFDNQE